MAKINIHAGDFGEGKGMLGFVSRKHLALFPPAAPGKFSWTGYGKSLLVELSEIERVSEGVATSLGRAVGWGVAGGILAGEVAAVVGAVVGGLTTEVTFAATFKDGKRLLATVDPKTYEKLAALVH